MNRILTWSEIEKTYPNEWVQLVDCEWPEGEPRPVAGRVRIHAASRKEFNKLVLEADPIDAARVYVGSHSLPKGTILSSNLVRIVPCE